MNKLADLRRHILAAPLKIETHNLLTWAEDGAVRSHRIPGRPAAFEMAYTAKVVVVGYTGAPQDLFFLLSDWLHDTCPGQDPEEVLKFHVDMPDLKSADVEITLHMTETVAGRDTDKGMALEPQPDPDATSDDFCLKTFMAELNGG